MSDLTQKLFQVVEQTLGDRKHSWNNLLIHGDNLAVLETMDHGWLRGEMEKQGGLKLVAIDPPFDVGADFPMEIEIGESRAAKKSDRVEKIAFRDKWGKENEPFGAMLEKRLRLIHSLLADDGSLYVHCDYRTNARIRLMLDDIFGQGCFLNEIIWSYKSGGVGKSCFARKHDTIFFYCKNRSKVVFNTQYYRSYQAKKYNYNPNYPELWDEEKKQWYHNAICRDVWDDIKIIGTEAGQQERLTYPTQKPEALLERIVRASSNEGDLVADFFCGSGTLPVVAEKLGRKWIAVDLGTFAVHTTRKRLLGLEKRRHGFDILKENDDSQYKTAPSIEAALIRDQNGFRVELVNYAGALSNESDEKTTRKKTRFAIENGLLVKIIRDKSGDPVHEVLTKHWSDWIDYWAVDFDFDPTGSRPFQNRWTAFRSKPDRKLTLQSSCFAASDGGVVAVKAIDVFCNETIQLMNVSDSCSRSESPSCRS